MIGIFAGFGIMLLVASPILLLAAPCILCCRCNKLIERLESQDVKSSSKSSDNDDQNMEEVQELD